MKPYFVTLAGRCLIGACALTLAACGNKGPLTLPAATGQSTAKKTSPTAPTEKSADHNSPAASKP